MKQSPDAQRIVERMRPGVLSRDGFLGRDRRPLREILEADRSAVVALRTRHEELAEALERAYRAGQAGLGRPVPLGGGLAAVFREAMGRIPCPWGGCGVFPKGEVEIAEASGGAALRLTALAIHMVRSHGFYQGRGSPYRLEPAVVCRLFGLGGQG